MRWCPKKIAAASPLLMLSLLTVIKAQQQAAPSHSLLATSADASRPALQTSTYTTTLTSGQARPTNAPSSQSIFIITSTLTEPNAAAASNTMSPASSTGYTTPPQSSSSNTDRDPNNLPLHTIIDPAFGILGAVLILTGLPLAFVGHRSQWYVCFLGGVYGLSIVTLASILRFGQARAIDDPSWTVKGLFLFASLCAGIIGGIFAIVFRQAGILATCSLGGLAFALFLQACRPSGLIEPIGLRYILYFCCISTFFAASCFSRLHYPVTIISTAIVGATATVLGLDCYIRANLKEFYVRNLGFDDLFVKRYPDAFVNSRWPISTSMIIELGVLAGTTFMAVALQGKMWTRLKFNLKLMRQQDRERQKQAETEQKAALGIFARAQRDMRLWKRKHNEVDDDEQLQSYANVSQSTLQEGSGKTHGGDVNPVLLLSTPAKNEALIDSDLAASMGLASDALLTSDDIEPSSDIPENGELQAKQELLEEIAKIRQSICELRSSSPAPSKALAYGHGSLKARTSVLFPAAALVDDRQMASMNAIRRSSSPWILTGSHNGAGVAQVGVQYGTRPHSSSFDMLQRPTSTHSHWAIQEGQPSVQAHDEPQTAVFARSFDSKRSLSRSLSRRSVSLAWPLKSSLSSSSASPIDQTYSGEPSVADRTRTRSLSRFQSNSRRSIIREPVRTVVGTPRNPIFTTHSSITIATVAAVPSVDSRPRSMTGEALQERHNARLSAMQRPVSVRMTEAAALTQARDEWLKRTTEERKRQQQHQNRHLQSQSKRHKA